MRLSDSVQNLPQVGPTYVKRLEKLEIRTVEDLIFHFPFRYDDFSLISPVARVQPGETVTLTATVEEIKNEYTKSGKKIQKATVSDNSGRLEITWFNQPFLIKTIKVGETYNFSGKAEWFGRKITLISPDYELRNEKTLHTGRLVPVYNETYGISSKWLRSRIKNALDLTENQIGEEEFLPEEILKGENLLSEKEAIINIHFPKDKIKEQQSRQRLAFDELFLIQLAALLRKEEWKKKAKGKRLSVDNDKVQKFIKKLPFTLTKTQERSLDEILTDLKKDIPMNRLLVGDVGSGKTVVATTAAYMTFLNRLKTLFMAPTEILANQHYDTLKTLLEPLGVKIKLITGSKVLHRLVQDNKAPQNKNAQVIIGTHALLNREFNNVGLVVIDEQHRFGVKQRALLTQKGNTPHVLTMTATPIPRTIALTLYNDLDLSVIDELPPGRAVTKTWVVPNHKRKDAYTWIKNKVKGTPEQSYIICPLVEESENLISVKAATKEFENLTKNIFPDLKLGLLHGRVKSEEKNKVLNDFKEGKTDILVATPVVEVGIDVPNATIMIIEGADRFGLAQLHQLRGRIGRRNLESYCFLFTESQKPEIIERLKHLEKNASGAQLAEIDLKHRGPGEIYGTKQHGLSNLKIATYTDINLVQRTRQIALSVVSSQLDNSTIHNSALLSRLEKYKINEITN